MSFDYEEENIEDAEINDNVGPKLFEITPVDGTSLYAEGYLGVTPAFVAVADKEGRVVFAMPMGRLAHVQAKIETSLSGQAN